jgi:acetoin utilization protein AcuB
MKYLHELLRNHTKLFVVYPSQTLDIAFEIMTHNHVHHLPVCEETDSDDSSTNSAGKLIGLISDRDIRLAVNSPLEVQKRDVSQSSSEHKRQFEVSFDDILLDLEKHTIAEVMQKYVMTVDEDVTILEAAKKMKSCEEGAIAVVQKGTQNLVGIYTRTDLADHLIRLLEPIAISSAKERPVPTENL